jgi:hypothetical protein
MRTICPICNREMQCIAHTIGVLFCPHDDNHNDGLWYHFEDKKFRFNSDSHNYYTIEEFQRMCKLKAFW